MVFSGKINDHVFYYVLICVRAGVNARCRPSGFSDFQPEIFRSFLMTYGHFLSEHFPSIGKQSDPEACHDSEMVEKRGGWKELPRCVLHARRHRVLPNLEREWYHVMAASASIRCSIE